MKTKLVLVAFVLLAGWTLSACTASKGGCKSTQQLVGYR
jgi:predicted small secreted protein